MRPTWNQYYMDMCELIATRATCDRKHVGAVITIENRCIASGYNSAIPGLDHCDDAGHLLIDGHCVRTIHAEINTIAQAAYMGVQLKDSNAILYCNTLPCWHCFKTIVSAGIRHIIYKDEYKSDGANLVKDMALQIPNFILEAYKG